jgi:hypothetical protein
MMSCHDHNHKWWMNFYNVKYTYVDHIHVFGCVYATSIFVTTMQLQCPSTKIWHMATQKSFYTWQMSQIL